MASLVKVVHVNVVQLPKNIIIFRLIFKKYNMVFAKKERTNNPFLKNFFYINILHFQNILKNYI